MSSYKFSGRSAFLLAMAGCVSLLAFSAAAKTPEPPGLFSRLPETAKATLTLPPQAIEGKSRAVKINYGQLRSGRLFLNLPGDISYEAIRELQQDLGKGRLAWVGHASDDPDNRVVIGVSGDAVAGTFTYHGKLFKLEPRANGSHVLTEVTNTAPLPESDPIPVGDTTSSATTDSTASTSVAAPSNGSVQDLLVAYTPAVQALYGTAGVDALIINAVAETNQAYSNSKMTTRLNLVRTVLTNYTESGSMQTDLDRLRVTNDGYMDELHTLRNTVGADLVSLIATSADWCGYAYIMHELSANLQSWAFSALSHGCATGNLVFAHEIGHNQGAQHDIANSGDVSLVFPYAHGYQDPNNSFRTIMAYDCPNGGCPRKALFSRGDNSIDGLPTGDDAYAANAVVIDKTAATIAAFRELVTQAPSAPANLSAIGASASHINLSWTDTGNIESGFVVERSTDNLNFTEIASLPANTQSYSNTNLPASTSYYYRTKAWNSVGNSPYSDVATAATQTPPAYIAHLVSSEWSGGGNVSGTFQNTTSKDGVRESIMEVESAGAKRQRYSYLEHYWVFTVQPQPGQSFTLYADVSTTATQSFTFAYSTSSASLTTNKAGWIDMFTVNSSNSGAKQFTLPASLSGPVYISVRDNSRISGVTTDSVNIDYLAIIRTNFSGPGC